MTLHKGPHAGKPLLSFVLPAWKGAWLSEAIESILKQTYERIELIVVDDCSPEDLCSIVARYQDSRLSYYRNEHNLGGVHLTKQWMHCVGLAKGDYVVIASDDDIYDRYFAERCMDLAVQYPEVTLVRAGVKDVKEDGELLWQDQISKLSGSLISQAEYVWAFKYGLVSICMGNLVFNRREVLNRGFKQYPRALGSDIVASIEYAERGMAVTNDILFTFRHSSVHLSGSLDQLGARMEATNLFFDWLMSYPIVPPRNEIDRKYFDDLDNEGWRRKCVRDYWNDIIRLVSPDKLFSYLARAKHASVWDKCIIVLRYIKYRIFD